MKKIVPLLIFIAIASNLNLFAFEEYVLTNGEHRNEVCLTAGKGALIGAAASLTGILIEEATVGRGPKKAAEREELIVSFGLAGMFIGAVIGAVYKYLELDDLELFIKVLREDGFIVAPELLSDVKTLNKLLFSNASEEVVKMKLKEMFLDFLEEATERNFDYHLKIINYEISKLKEKRSNEEMQKSGNLFYYLNELIETMESYQRVLKANKDSLVSAVEERYAIFEESLTEVISTEPVVANEAVKTGEKPVELTVARSEDLKVEKKSPEKSEGFSDVEDLLIDFA
ncbi:hypothetical protein KAW80_01685 [Candidatus Babeliales bacterium]|nr:hypothetical protein [Candidatus Babeliales bacterium]